jgi:hypothetical protein
MMLGLSCTSSQNSSGSQHETMLYKLHVWWVRGGLVVKAVRYKPAGRGFLMV